MSQIQPFDDIFSGIYNWATQDKIFHYGSFRGTFVVGNTITGSISGATGTITYLGANHIRYTKTSLGNFQKNDVVTNGAGASCTAKNINEFHGDVTDRIYFQEAPELESQVALPMPYTVYKFLGEVPQDPYNGKLTKMAIIWDLFTNDASSLPLFNILSDLHTLFDFPEPIFTYWHFTSFLRQGTSAVTKDANKIWTCSVEYELIVKQK